MAYISQIENRSDTKSHEMKFQFVSGAYSWMIVFLVGTVLMIAAQPALPFSLALVASLALLQLILANMKLLGKNSAIALSRFCGAMLLSSLLYSAILIAHVFLESYGLIATSIASAVLFIGLASLELIASFAVQFAVPVKNDAAIRCANQIDAKYGGFLGALK